MAENSNEGTRSADDDILRGGAFILGDDVNTDLNCTGKYLPGKDEAYIAAHAFEEVSPGFAARFSAGGIIVAGKHFGINSSREQAIQILKRMGVSAILAPSFGRQFFRNAINNGLPALEVDTSGIVDGDDVCVDLAGNVFTVPARDISRALRPMPTAIRVILKEGGLFPFLRKYPQWELPT